MLYLQSFPIGEEQLIQHAKDLFAAGSGVDDDTLLADNFRFEFPVISLDKEVQLLHQPCVSYHQTLQRGHRWSNEDGIAMYYLAHAIVHWPMRHL